MFLAVTNNRVTAWIFETRHCMPEAFPAHCGATKLNKEMNSSNLPITPPTDRSLIRGVAAGKKIENLI
jgi:hypothetical protein